MYGEQKKLEEKTKLINLTLACSLCNRKVISLFQCSNCNKIFCHLCLEEYQNKNKKFLCPFKCLNTSFKSLNISNNLLFDFKNIKRKYARNLSLLKKIKEIENKLDIGYLTNLNSNYLSITFKSKFHNHYLYNNVMKDYRWICDICENEFEVKTKRRYRCEPCDFDICEECRLLEELGYNFKDIFLSKFHEHLLRDKTLNQSDWVCDVCNKEYEMETIKRFRCDKCDFDICGLCKIREIRNPNGFFYNLLISIYNLYYIS